MEIHLQLGLLMLFICGLHIIYFLRLFFIKRKSVGYKLQPLKCLSWRLVFYNCLIVFVCVLLRNTWYRSFETRCKWKARQAELNDGMCWPIMVLFSTSDGNNLFFFLTEPEVLSFKNSPWKLLVTSWFYRAILITSEYALNKYSCAETSADSADVTVMNGWSVPELMSHCLCCMRSIQ